MCGIAGFIAGQGAADAGALAPMLARIAHRGPDGQGTFVEGPAALGHCRLAIIDLAGGAQPLYSEDKNLVIVFNGEIYNYKALTAELTALGHCFATRTDTEVLLHGWEQWGRELLPRLRGMFAFALWDRRAGTLFCARDMFGIKPLYYCRCADGTLLFASEIKAFLDHPSFEKRLNAAQLPLYLSCQYSPGRDTFFAGVEKLLPGHFLIFSDGIVRTTRWVQPAFLPGETPVPPSELEAVLRDSTTAHKIADVEVAGFLSGGVDSAYITALARPGRTYTISYAEPRYDESFPARALARSLGADLVIDPATERIEELILMYSDGQGFDAVIDAAGELSAIENAVGLLARGGTLMLFSNYKVNDALRLSLMELYWKQITILTSFGIDTSNYTADSANILRHLNIACLIDQILPLDEFQHAMQLYGSRQCLRILLKI